MKLIDTKRTWTVEFTAEDAEHIQSLRVHLQVNAEKLQTERPVLEFVNKLALEVDPDER